jgi:hypothetical protein
MDNKMYVYVLFNDTLLYVKWMGTRKKDHNIYD